MTGEDPSPPPPPPLVKKPVERSTHRKMQQRCIHWEWKIWKTRRVANSLTNYELFLEISSYSMSRRGLG